MKIAIVGAGAMGSIFGARFAHAGHDTVLVDVAQPLVDKINADGVTVVRGEEESTTRVAATTNPASIGSGRPRRLLHQVLPHGCRRGVRTAARRPRHRRRVPPERVGERRRSCGRRSRRSRSSWVCTIQQRSGARPRQGNAPRRADQRSSVPFVDGAGPRSERLAQALADAGLATTVADPVRPEIWKKLILNAATLPASALTGMTAGAFGAHEPSRELVADTAREATTVANALGFAVDPEERVSAILALLEKAGSSKGSMLQDFEAGRRTEIDVINGAVVKAADEAGVEVPINRTFVRLVKGWEAQRGLS